MNNENDNQKMHDFHVKHARNHKSRGLGFALLLVAAGILFLLVNTGAIPTEFRSLLTAWPIWIILAGFITLLSRGFGASIILFTVGIFFMIPFLRPIYPEWNIPYNFHSMYWPVLLVVAGVFLIIERLLNKNHIFFCTKPEGTSSFSNEDGYLNIETSFDERKNIFLDPVFRGGHIKTTFGEFLLDLRKTSLPEGNTTLYVNVSFGQAIIIVPTTWNVSVQGDAAFGTFNDRRLTHNYYPDEPKKLIITGKVSFGECQIRD